MWGFRRPSPRREGGGGEGLRSTRLRPPGPFRASQGRPAPLSAPRELGPPPGPRTLRMGAGPAARSRRPWRVRSDGCACARGAAGASVGALESKGPEFEPRVPWSPLSDAQTPSSGVRLPQQSARLARSVRGGPRRPLGLGTVPAPSLRAVPELLSLDGTPQPRRVGGWGHRAGTRGSGCRKSSLLQPQGPPQKLGPGPPQSGSHASQIKSPRCSPAPPPQPPFRPHP